MAETETLNTPDMNETSDVAVVGDPGLWRLLCKESSASQGWVKSTSLMATPCGVVLRVSTQQGDNVAEAVTFIQGATVSTGEDGMPILVPLNG